MRAQDLIKSGLVETSIFPEEDLELQVFLSPFGFMRHLDGAQDFVHTQKALPTKVHLTAFQQVSELPMLLLSQVAPPLSQ